MVYAIIYAGLVTLAFWFSRAPAKILRTPPFPRRIS